MTNKKLFGRSYTYATPDLTSLFTQSVRDRLLSRPIGLLASGLVSLRSSVEAPRSLRSSCRHRPLSLNSASAVAHLPNKRGRHALFPSHGTPRTPTSHPAEQGCQSRPSDAIAPSTLSFGTCPLPDRIATISAHRHSIQSLDLQGGMPSKQIGENQHFLPLSV